MKQNSPKEIVVGEKNVFMLFNVISKNDCDLYIVKRNSILESFIIPLLQKKQ